jgi:hypothetical protein
MQREVFADTALAAWINEHMIPVMADRHLQPEVDAYYSDACRLMDQESCGWPLNVIALPDGLPIYASSRLSKAALYRLLNTYRLLYEQSPEEARRLGWDMQDRLYRIGQARRGPEARRFEAQELDQVYEQLMERMDWFNGSLQAAEKAPFVHPFQFLLTYQAFSGRSPALQAVSRTLDRLAYGGLYDHLGGGFFRAARDASWREPYFEKMLYDNAQLLSLYAQAYKATRNPLYERVAYETAAAIERDFAAPEGGYYASLDAVSEGENGRYYVWPQIEIEGRLGPGSALFTLAYNTETRGNWQRGQNILYRTLDDEQLAAAFRLPSVEVQSQLEQQRDLMRKGRSLRVRPAADKTRIAAWNALALRAWVDAYEAFQDPDFLDKALRSADYIESRLAGPNGSLFRAELPGGEHAYGRLDDYACLIEAYLALYQASFQEKWVYRAEELLLCTLSHFYDPASGMFFYTEAAETPAFMRRMDLSDEELPSSNAMMCRNLLILGDLLRKDSYRLIGRQMLRNYADEALPDGAFHASWAHALCWEVYPNESWLLLGERAPGWNQQLAASFRPLSLRSGGKYSSTLPGAEGKERPYQSVAYVSRGDSTAGPAYSLHELLLSPEGGKRE